MSKKYLILIIDDDPSQHMILGDYLKLSGYEVLHAENGEQGLRLLEEKKPDMILLDVQMPGMDGFQVLETIRKKASNRNVSIVMLTALDRRHLKIKGLELGADDYVTKPFDRAELLARINAILRRSDRNRILEGVMEGDLSDVGLSELLQSMELSMKTAVVSLKDLNAEIIIDKGELLFVRMGNFIGEDALLRMFLLEKGYFSIKFNEIPSGISGAPKSMTSVLMNVSNDVDEIRHLIRQLGVENRRLRFTDDITDFPMLEKIRHITPATFTEMIVAMDEHPKKNIKILIDASKMKKLKIEKE